MLEQDYIVRMIRELVRTILKLLFHIDDVDDSIELENEEANELYQNIMVLVKQGNINDAENYLLEHMNLSNLETLKASLLFYDQLNQLSEELLEQADFSRDEIKEGIQTVLKQFGYESIMTAF